MGLNSVTHGAPLARNSAAATATITTTTTTTTTSTIPKLCLVLKAFRCFEPRLFLLV